MSERTETTIRVQIIVLYKSDTTDLEENEDSLNKSSFIVKYKEFLEMVLSIPNAKIVDIVPVQPVKKIITKKLFATCIDNEADIIFIIGDVKSTDNEAHYANETIETVTVNRQDLSTKLANLMTEMEKKVEEITHFKARCGMRNKTLFINLSGTHEDQEKYFAAISDMIVNAIICNKENPSCSSDTASSFDKDFPEQEKAESSNEEEISLSSTSSLTETINDDNSNNPHTDSFPMISLEDAMMILNEVANVNKNFVSVNARDAHGRILCEDVHSNCNVPPFKTSTKHGYAVFVKDGKGIRKVQKEENGFPPLPLQPGTCAWINSGAPIPEGATAVVQVKDTKPLPPNDDIKYIEIMTVPQHGQNIKTVGYDVMKNKIIINKFTRIGPEEMGLLAACGCKDVLVAKQLSIGVLSIGDNLEEPGVPLREGYIYDSNRITLISLLKHNGYSSLDLGIVNNKIWSIWRKIEKALREVDILVTTGCINDKDSLKNILIKYFEAKIHFGNINIKPGKSTTLASCQINDDTKYCFCLSGNPISAITTAHLLLLPFVNNLHRYKFSEPATVPVQTEDPFILHRRPRLAWVHVHWPDKKISAKASSVLNLDMDRLCDLVNSNALLVLPEKKEKEFLPKADNTPALLFYYPRNIDH